MNLVDVALACLRRGWYVFPCKPRSKEPCVAGGFKAATIDEQQVRDWWGKWSDANVAIATGPSRLTVLDIDHGLDAVAICIEDFPATYAVRTGRRPELGVQLYYEGGGLKSIPWQRGKLSGDIRSATGYVMAAGSIHPSGHAYEMLNNVVPAELPDFVRSLSQPATDFSNAPDAVSDETAQDWRTWLYEYAAFHAIELRGYEKRVANGWWLGIVCPWVGEHSSGAGAESSTVLGCLDGRLAFECSHSTCKLAKRDTAALRALNTSFGRIFEPEPGIGPAVLLGTGLPLPSKEPIDWRTRYMTEDAFEHVKPPEFLIDGFLVKKSIAMLGGPVAQRKSIIALNVAHALCTGEPLFGYFNVTEKPTRTVYLCPEMGAASFVKRIKQIGLGEHVGKTLFIQTMSEQPTALDELDGELPGAVVIVDTITRFIEGDENKSDDMRLFARKVFRLVNAGATVVLLHHSKKGSSGSLDDGLRGSSELAAFVDSCWVTELEDTKKPYESLSKIRNVKQRDFESDPFRLKPAPGSYYLTMEGDPAPEAVIRDKKEEAAREALAVILKDSPKWGINKLRDALKAKGYGRGQKWVTAARCEILGTGSVLVSD